MNAPTHSVQAAASLGHIGESVRRREDLKFIVGQGQYVDDMAAGGALVAVFVRSPHAHAKILGIDHSALHGNPDVVRVLTSADLAGQVAGVPCRWQVPGIVPVERPPLAEGSVRFAGDAVAVVIATSRAAATDAAEQVIVEYEERDAIANQELACALGAPQVHDHVAGNVAVRFERKAGDYAAAAAGAAHVVTARLINQRLLPTCLEPRAVVASFDAARGVLHFAGSNQGAHVVKTQLARALGHPENLLHVVVPDVGGGFGAKLALYPEDIVVAYAAKLLGQRVAWCETRAEASVATSHGRDHIQDVELCLDQTGKITGLKVHSFANLGAYYAGMGPGVPTFLFGGHVTGCYDIRNLDLTVLGVLTHTTPTDTYRGAGRPESTYLIERIADIAARQIKMDPAEFRKRNFIPPDAFPYRLATGILYDSGEYAKNLDVALERVGYAALRTEQKTLRAQGRHLGIGISTYVETCGQAPSHLMETRGFFWPGWESATVRVHPDGNVTLLSGSSSHGQGHHTTFAQIVATVLTIDSQTVEVVQGDTQVVQQGNGTFNSRSLPVGGTAAHHAALQVRDKAMRFAEFLMEAGPGEVKLDNGTFTSAGGLQMGWKEIAAAAFNAHKLPPGDTPCLDVTHYYDPKAYTAPNGTHIAVVEVDVETGQVELRRYVAIDDCGNIINPMIVEGQIHGGVAQGVGQALYEHGEYSENAQLLTGTLMDYAVPRARHLPAFETGHTVTPTPMNALGAKGVAEGGTIAAPPALVNAVVDALETFGIHHIDMPMTQQRVWRAISEAQTQQGAK